MAKERSKCPECGQDIKRFFAGLDEIEMAATPTPDVYSLTIRFEPCGHEVDRTHPDFKIYEETFLQGFRKLTGGRRPAEETC